MDATLRDAVDRFERDDFTTVEGACRRRDRGGTRLGL